MPAHTAVWTLVLLLVAVTGSPRAVGADVGDHGKTPIQRTALEAPASGQARSAVSAGTTLVLLGLLLGGAILARRVIQHRVGRRTGRTPRNAVRLVSRQQIDAELNVRLLQVGPRLLVVAATPQGVTTLAEITDPEEIALVTGETTAAVVAESLFAGGATIATHVEPATSSNHEMTPPVADRQGASRIRRAVSAGGSR